MTAVHVHLTTPKAGTTTRAAAVGSLQVSLYRRAAEASERFVLVTGYAVPLIGGEATLQLTATTGDNVWVVDERVKDGKKRLVAVPDATGTIEYATLPDIDPVTLTPSVDTVPAWTAAAAAATAARDQAYTARDQAQGYANGSLQKTANLSDVPAPATARTNLGLGTAATHAHADYDAAGAATSAQTAAAADATTKASAAQANAVQRSNHTGTQTADSITDGTTNKAYTATERTKLAGITAGATVNATDAQLRDRSTHTGTQPAATVTGLAAVATSGAYSDLTGTPPAATSYTDEQAQDAAAALFTTGTHSGITFAYDDAGNKINATVTGGGSSTNTDPRVYKVGANVAFDGSTDIRAGFQSSLDAAVSYAQAGGRAVVEMPAGVGALTSGTTKQMPLIGTSTTARYSTASGFALPVNLTGTLTIRGQGEHATTVRLSTACRNLFYVDKQNDYDTFQNVTFQDFAVDNNGTTGQNHVICGTVPSNNSPQTRLNLYNLTHRRVRVFGIPDDHTWDQTANNNAGQYTMPTTKKAAFVYHSKQAGDYEAGTTPGSLPLTPWPGRAGATTAKWNYVVQVLFEDVTCLDGQRAILVVSDITQNSSIWYDDINLRRCYHEQAAPWEGWAPQTSFYVGGNCQGGRAEITDCTSINVGDDGIEFGGLQELLVRNFRVVNPVLDGILVRYSQPPANASTVKIVVENMHHSVTAAALNNDTITRSDGSTGRRSFRSRPFEIKTEGDALNLTLGQVVLRNPKTVIEGGYFQTLNRSQLLGWNSTGPVSLTVIENPLVVLRNFTLDYSTGTYLCEMFTVRAATGETGATVTTKIRNAEVLVENLSTAGAKFEFHGFTPSGNGDVELDGLNFTTRNASTAAVARYSLAHVGYLATAYSAATARALSRVRLRNMKGTVIGATATVRRGVVVLADETFGYLEVDGSDFRGWAVTADVDVNTGGTNAPLTVLGTNWYQNVPVQGRRNPQAASYTVKNYDTVVAVTSTAAARTITLPAIATVPVGRPFTVVDESNGAGSQNITIATNASETFLGGGTTRAITVNGGAVTVASNGTTWTVTNTYAPATAGAAGASVDVGPSEYGLYAYSLAPSEAGSSSSLPTGAVVYSQCRVATTGTPSSVGIRVGTAPTSTTTFKVAVYDANGNQVGVGSDATVPQTAGDEFVSVTMTRALTAGEDIYLAVLWVGSGTLSVLGSTTSPTLNFGRTGSSSSPYRSSSQTGQTDIPSTLPFASTNASTTARFIALR